MRSVSVALPRILKIFPCALSIRKRFVWERTEQVFEYPPEWHDYNCKRRTRRTSNRRYDRNCKVQHNAGQNLDGETGQLRSKD